MASSFTLGSNPIPIFSPLFSAKTVKTTKTLKTKPFLRPFFSISSLHYGPSLPKTAITLPTDSPTVLFDRDRFTRVYDLSALRVRADQCAALETRLRGHLLNWPRIRNIARVPGDDVDPQILKLLWREQDAGLQGPLCPVLYRDKLAREFNCRGFLKFRNLAKMSRPKKKNKEKQSKEDGTEVRRKSSFSVVEIVQGKEEDDGDDLSGLLGEDRIGGGRWSGSTRLLLLDEHFANKAVEELPQAIKVVLQGDVIDANSTKSELVHCQLTLFYDYWPMNEILHAVLPEGMIVPSAFETVGHIAHMNLKGEHLPYKMIIAQVVFDKNKPNIKTVVNKIDSIQNEYRTMDLEVLAGNHSLVTTVVENGIRFNVDLANMYWNSRLSTERQRLICSFSSSDVVCDVFAGVGPIAISAAKKVKYVYANDLNPNAVDYLERNIVLNKLDRKIEVFKMDARRFINSIFSNQRPHSITQVVMNLPKDAAEFLDAFRGVFTRLPRGAGSVLPKIHVYGFSNSNNPEFDFEERIKVALCVSAVGIEMHRVRLVAPRKWMLCASFFLPKPVAFGKSTWEF